ncbi:MAG: OmpH family outer membrane protein [Fibrobacter sp.]|nr:OmpH family outer membrane protein [Fibrobacter sp.]
MNKIPFFIAVTALALSILGWGVVGITLHKEVRYGFVNTERLLNEFSESKKAIEKIDDEKKKWDEQRTIISDSLKAFETRMEKMYDSLSIGEKKKIKEEQLHRIEEFNHFNQASAKSLEKRRVEELQAIYEKINAAMVDFAGEKNIDIVFATSNGNIVYGNGTSADLTDDFLRFLNERFK